MTRRRAAWGLALTVGLVACTGEADTAGTAPPPITVLSPPTTVPATTSPPATTPPPAPGPVAAPVRHPAASHAIYFVMSDRFENGEPGNDTGGIAGGPLDHGFLPEDKGYYQGGDLAGLTARLPYIAGMGMTAIWITPPFTNRAVQGAGATLNSSAGYHGYWQIDWTRIDPHLGTEADMQALLAEAGRLGIDVFFDIVINHTGDVIAYREGSFAYRSKAAAPYRDAAGAGFDDADFAGTDSFPDLSAEVSFPYTPIFRTPADATVKRPEWLNDPVYYHNRGDSTFVGESASYGDFFGLDDLFTEQPAVVANLVSLYIDIISRYDVAGFRIDTVKHVNDEFWAEWTPAVLDAAAAAGRPDFFMFGEVFGSDPILNSHYTTELGLPALLDFIVNDGLRGYVAEGLPADVLAAAFDQDDWFTDADSNASMSVKFFGNHDIGRMGRAITLAGPGARPAVVEEAMVLGFDLLFLTRGVPVVYYGDEQGFVGIGGDKSARQTMFPTTVAEYIGQATIGSEATVGDDNFDPDHPFYRHIRALNELRAAHPTLVSGAQIVHEPAGSVFSVSRIDRDLLVEYVVVANNAPLPVTALIPTLSPGTEFAYLHGGAGALDADSDGMLSVRLPARRAAVLMALEPLPAPAAPVTVSLVRPGDGDQIPTPRFRLEARLGDRRYAEVTFAVAVDGGDPMVLGTDDAPPYRVYWNNAGIPAGAKTVITATVDDRTGRLVSDSVTVTMGARS